jgi:hypothetical protein
MHATLYFRYYAIFSGKQYLQDITFELFSQKTRLPSSIILSNQLSKDLIAFSNLPLAICANLL